MFRRRSKHRKCHTNIPFVSQVDHVHAVLCRLGVALDGRNHSWSESSSTGEGEDKVLAKKIRWVEETDMSEMRKNAIGTKRIGSSVCQVDRVLKTGVREKREWRSMMKAEAPESFKSKK